MFVYHKTINWSMFILCLVLCSVCLATPATYTVTGKLEFKHDSTTGINDIGSSSSDGKIPFPINTHIELVKWTLLGGWDVVEKDGDN